MSGNATHTGSRRRPSRVPPLKPLTLTMQQASAVTGLGLSKLYQKIRDGTLQTIMVDGRRLIDSVYDMAPIGTDFPLDVSQIERVEVIRGPGSSLYGTSAFFAVVNVFTSTGASRQGLQLETSAGTLHTGAALASFGGVAEDGPQDAPS